MVNANDLFLNIWSSRLNSEDYDQPGSDDWEKNRNRIHHDYLKAWIDCQKLVEHLNQFDYLSNAVNTIKSETQSTGPCMCGSIECSVCGMEDV